MNNINIHTGTPSEATEQPQAGKSLFAPSRTGVLQNALTFTFITALLAFALTAVFLIEKCFKQQEEKL